MPLVSENSIILQNTDGEKSETTNVYLRKETNHIYYSHGPSTKSSCNKKLDKKNNSICALEAKDTSSISKTLANCKNTEFESMLDTNSDDESDDEKALRIVENEELLSSDEFDSIGIQEAVYDEIVSNEDIFQSSDLKKVSTRRTESRNGIRSNVEDENSVDFIVKQEVTCEHDGDTLFHINLSSFKESETDKERDKYINEDSSFFKEPDMCIDPLATSSVCINDSGNFGKENNQKESSDTMDSFSTLGIITVDTDNEISIKAEVLMPDEDGNFYENELPIDHNDDESNLDIEINNDSKEVLLDCLPLYNKIPSDGTDLNTWQLNHVSLPPFTPLIPPPNWLSPTIPPEGYSCHSCGDRFFIENSLAQHKERRTILITLECTPCDKELTFYNKCSYKDHVREHQEKNEHVDEKVVVVQSLPLQFSRLLQPMLVPISYTVNPENSREDEIHESQSKETDLNTQMSGSSEDSVASYIDRSESSKKCVICYLCKKNFSSVRQLMSHMRTNRRHSDRRVECRKCLLVLPSVCAAKAHILTHSSANTGNISVCPECGSRCAGPREFVHHLNTCGHQYRRSGILCSKCDVCFFKFTNEFVNHWIREHCTKSYRCTFCKKSFGSLVFHECIHEQGTETFLQCRLVCPLCDFWVQFKNEDEKGIPKRMMTHLKDSHASILNRVHYIFKSKFCVNAFRSKDELRTHHDKEHRTDDHYLAKKCSLQHEVLGNQSLFFSGQEARNAFISIPITLSPEELRDAQARAVPTVSSVIDKGLFPDTSTTTLQAHKSVEKRTSNLIGASSKDDTAWATECIKPCICYRCGYTFSEVDDSKLHMELCKGEVTERLCQICGFLGVGQEFAKHCSNHIEDGLAICIFCNGRQFSSLELLQLHFELHVYEQFSYPTFCPFCPKTFLLDASAALEHLSKKHKNPCGAQFPEKYGVNCHKCGRKFHGDRGLNVHLTRCSAGNEVPANTPLNGTHCFVCKKILTNELYGKHIINHLDEGLFICGLCNGMTLPSKPTLLRHLEDHASSLNYPFTCPVCSRTLSDSTDNYNLFHIKEDHGFGNISCPSCKMVYTFTHQFQRHCDIVHKVCLYAKRRYICWICRAYDHGKKQTLLNHFKVVHGIDEEKIDEKVMIRTRGHGKMPSSQYIPVKNISNRIKILKKSNDKLMLSQTNCKQVTSSEANQIKLTISRPTPGEQFKVVETKECTSEPALESTEIKLENLVINKELLDVISQFSDSRSINMNEKITIFRGSGSDNTNSISKKDVATTSTANIPMVVIPKKDLEALNISKENLEPPTDNSIIYKKPKVKLKKPMKFQPMKSSKNFTTQDKNAKIHRKSSSTNQRVHRCKLCRFKTTSKYKFLRHSAKHKRKQSKFGFVCDQCGESFVVEPSLKRHLFFAHKIKTQPTISTGSPKIPPQSPQIPPQPIIQTKKKITHNKTKPTKKISIKMKNEVKRVAKTERKNAVEENGHNFRCSICREKFASNALLHSHLRKHGMAFLKIGRRNRRSLQNTTV